MIRNWKRYNPHKVGRTLLVEHTVCLSIKDSCSLLNLNDAGFLRSPSTFQRTSWNLLRKAQLNYSLQPFYSL